MLYRDPLSPLNDVPWGIDLDAVEPLPSLPREALVVSITRTFTCPSCMQEGWLTMPGEAARCQACGFEAAPPALDWQGILRPDLEMARSREERLWRTHRVHEGLLFLSTQRLRIIAYACECGAPLPALAELHQLATHAGSEGYPWTCAACGRARRVYAQTPELRAVDPVPLLFSRVEPPS